MPLEKFRNLPVPSDPSTAWALLTTGVDAVTTTLAVTSKALFPAVPFRLRIADEYLLATADAAALSYTVSRGIEDSTPAIHASGASVYGVLTLGGLANFPGVMTTAGDTISLDGSGTVIRVPAGTYTTPAALSTALGPYLLSATAASTYQPIGSYLSATLPGADTQILLNDGGALGAFAGLTFKETTDLTSVAGDANLRVVNSNTRRAGEFGADYALGTNAQWVEGVYPYVYNSGAGRIGEASAIYADLENLSTGIISRGAGVYAYLYNDPTGTIETWLAGTWIYLNDIAGTVPIVYGHYVTGIDSGSPTSFIQFWGEDAAGSATNPYLLWGDGRAVRRIKYETDGNMTDRWYNVDFTKYVPGAANQESLEIGRWNSNVVSVGPSASGTGVLRAMRLTGASVAVDGPLTAANLSGTNTGDQNLSAYALIANVVPNTRTVNGSALSSNVTISTITGNAGTATALQTPRTINGVSFDGTGNISIPVGTGDALVANPLSQFAATTSLQLKNTISDETGSGALVFADTPTLVTPILGVATGTRVTWSPSGAVGLTVTGATETTSQPLISGTQTWNAVGTTFYGEVLNITDTASAFGSCFVDYRVAGTSKASIRKDGQVLAISVNATTLYAGSNVVLGFGADVVLARDAANVLALKSGTAAQEIRVYGTTTGTKYLSLKHDGTNPIIGSSSGGLKVNSTAVTPATTGTRYLIIDTAGNITSSATAPSGT